MRTYKEIKQLIEVYPERWRRWCSAPEAGGCACLGCVRVPAPSTVRGDPEGQPFPNPTDELTKEEVELYQLRLRKFPDCDGAGESSVMVTFNHKATMACARCYGTGKDHD